MRPAGFRAARRERPAVASDRGVRPGAEEGGVRRQTGTKEEREVTLLREVNNRMMACAGACGFAACQPGIACPMTSTP